MGIKLKMLAALVALVAGASSGAMAQYACPPGYSSMPASASQLRHLGIRTRYRAQYAARRPERRRGMRPAVQLARSSAGRLAPQPAPLREPPICSHRRRHAPPATCTTTELAIPASRTRLCDWSDSAQPAWEDEHGVSTRRHCRHDLGRRQVHAPVLQRGKTRRRALAALGANGTENIVEAMR
jgi:hypothetical protein